MSTSPTDEQDEYFYSAQDDFLIRYWQPVVTPAARGAGFAAAGWYRLASVHGVQESVLETYTGRAVESRESVGLRYREKVICGAAAITKAQAEAHLQRWGVGAV